MGRADAGNERAAGESADEKHFAYSVEHPCAVTKEEVERALVVYEKLSKCSELV